MRNETAVDCPPVVVFLNFLQLKNNNTVYLVRTVVSSLIPVWWENAGGYVGLRGERAITYEPPE